MLYQLSYVRVARNLTEAPHSFRAGVTQRRHRKGALWARGEPCRKGREVARLGEAG